VAFEQGRLDVITAGQIAVELSDVATDQQFGFLLAQIQVRLDLAHLLLRGLRTHHAIGVERVALLDRCDALQHALDELVVDRFLDQGAGRAGAHFTLVESEQHHAFDRFVEEAVIFVHDVGKEDVGRLAAQFQRCWNQVVGSGLRDNAAGGGRAGEGDFGNALAGGERHAGFAAIAVHDIQHARRQQVGDGFNENQDGDRG